jgi:hypothetical protein
MNGVPYYVLGSTLYSLDLTQDAEGDPVYTLNSKGTITGMGRVSMADNGTQLVIQVPGGTGYVFDGTTLAAITDTDFTANGNPQYVSFIDGYFVFSTDSKKFIASDVNDGTSYDPLYFGTAEADPDDIVAPFVFSNQLIMFGSETHEVFQNIGGTAFPFQRLPGAVNDVGLVAPLSLQKFRTGFMFLGAGEYEDAAFYFSTGSRPERVSTEPIDNAVQAMSRSEQEGCHSWSYSKDGHDFVGFQFATRTFVYDVTTGAWHERKSTVSGVQISYRIESVVQAYGLTICGDAYDGRIGKLDNDVYTEYGSQITREVSFLPLVAQAENIFVTAFEVTPESGTGNDDVEDPQIEMRLSRDGQTWTDWTSRSIGKIGEYNQRCVWRRLGRMPRLAVFALRCTDKAKAKILRVDMDIG